MHEISPSCDNVAMGQGTGVGDLLSDSHHTRADCRLAARAIRERWPVPDSAKSVVVDRLLAIIEKKSVDIHCKNGETASVAGPADVNAVAAARVLVAMAGQNQSDEHFATKLDSDARKNPDGDTINIGCVGSIALGQEPLTAEDAKRQAQEVLARVKARIGQQSPPPQENVGLDAAPSTAHASVPKSWSLNDL